MADAKQVYRAKPTPDEIEDVRKRALVGSGVQKGPGLEYWKRKA